MAQNYKTKTFLQAKRTENNKINVDELDIGELSNFIPAVKVSQFQRVCCETIV